MGIRVIGQKKFEVTETELLQQDLLFYLDNPRVYSVLHENGHDNPTQTEIEEIMCSLDHVKSLKSQIMQNGGLIEPLIVVKRKDRYVVLEGNSRLAAYRILAKNDPLKWSRVLVQILPEDISDSDIFTLLGTFHLNPKKDWSKFEQAAYIYRQKKELGCSDSALGKQVGISAITVKKYCEIYGLMVEHNDTHQSHWNMYEQYVQNKGIKQYRNTYPEMDSFFAKQVKTGEIVRAQDVRDILGKIASDEGKSSTHIMQDYIKGDIDLEEAHARFEATGRSGDNYEKVKKFQRLISEKDFCDELKKEAVGNSKDILFSLRKINTAVTQLMKEIDKKKIVEKSGIDKSKENGYNETVLVIALQDGFTMRRSLIVEDILLIEPAYKNKYPPIGLMKIAYFHRYIMHDYVRFAKGRLPEGLENKKWDRVYVTTLFTFEWENTKKALQYALSVVKPGGKVFTGGILATLRPEWIAKEFPTVINNTGLLNHEGTLGLKGEECIDTLPLDYGILDDIKDEYKYPAEDAYFTYMTRGCGMNCTFCAVKTLEPTYEPYVSISDSIKRIDKEFGPKRDLLLMDNNVLRSPKFDQIIDEIKALGFEKGATFVNPKTGKTVVRHVDFNQGLDAFLLNEHKAQRLGELAIKPARIAFDHIEDEDVYVRAITLCARAGIDHMSNYLLYNGEDFTGKGHSYHADTPEDLFYRMHLTMELGENLTEELGRKIAIFSFPMRYIPLDNDQRGFIGANWNAKYLRALQCMLIPTQGKGIQGRSFFEADFGKTAEDFVMYLAMPERLLNKRGHFVERKDEPKFEREIRYTQWSENRHLIDTWMKYYSMFEKDTVLEYIGCNRFSVETLDKIENEELKKLYFFYLTPSATIRVFSDCTEDTKRIISTFILEELPFMYSRIVETILSSKPGYKVIAGILENFGEKVCTDLLKKIDLFSGHDNDKLTMLIKANKSKRLVDFDFSLLQFIPYFHVSNLLSKQEEQIIMNSAYELKEAPIRKILLLHLDELKDVLIKTNGAQPGDTQIISVIEEQIKELYHQISIFEL